jgi:4-amino-4-deoxy-L-arabinose transferase-like glycosyltransferase
LLYFAFFHQLGRLSVRNWDEGRNAVNALEMLQKNELIVTYYHGQVDNWNVKPPFFIWLIAASMKIFGMDEVGLRLPSAIIAVITCLFLVYFSCKYLNDIRIGIVASLVLMTTLGFNGIHVARTADFDVLVVFCITLYSLYYFLYLDTSDAKSKRTYIYLTILFLTLAVLSKSVAGLMMLAGMFVYTVVMKELKEVLQNKHFYIGILLFFVVIAVYYLTRDYLQPGYIKTVILEEPGRMVVDTEDNYDRFKDFYFTGMMDGRFVPWIYLFPFCLLIGLFSNAKKIKNFVLYCAILCAIYFLIITFAATKNYQYDAPIYPFAALLIGIGLVIIFDSVLERYNYLRFKNAGFIGILFLLFAMPFYNVFNKNITYPDKANYPRYSTYLKLLKSDHSEIKKYTVANSYYNAHLLFYTNAYNLKDPKADIKVLFYTDPKCLEDTIVTCENEVYDYYKNNYSIEILHQNESEGCWMLKIVGPKIILK